MGILAAPPFVSLILLLQFLQRELPSDDLNFLPKYTHIIYYAANIVGLTVVGGVT